MIIWGFVPITASGFAVLAICGVSFWYIGLTHSDLVLLPATLALLLVACIMILAVLISSFIAAKRWKMLSESKTLTLNLETDYARETGVVLKMPWLPFVEISWTWVDPDTIESQTRYKACSIIESITAKHRGSFSEITRRFSVSDVVGLSKVTWEKTEPANILILPNKGKLERSNIMKSLSGGEDLSDPYGDPKGDRIEMRQYVAGDSARSIIWKVFARNRRLVVRMPERALTARPRTCAYLVAGPLDEASASLARIVLERHMLGDNWCFGADGSPGTVNTVSQALEFIAFSGNKNIGYSRLCCFLRNAEALGYQSCLVFVPAQDGDWLELAKAQALRTRLGITWFVGVDNISVAQTTPISALDNLLLMPPHEISCNPTPVVEVLQSSSGSVVLCDRRNGRIIPDALNYLKAQEKVS